MKTFFSQKKRRSLLPGLALLRNHIQDHIWFHKRSALISCMILLWYPRNRKWSWIWCLRNQWRPTPQRRFDHHHWYGMKKSCLALDMVSKKPYMVFDMVLKKPYMVFDMVSKKPCMVFDMVSKKPYRVFDMVSKKPYMILVQFSRIHMWSLIWFLRNHKWSCYGIQWSLYGLLYGCQETIYDLGMVSKKPYMVLDIVCRNSNKAVDKSTSFACAGN